MATVPDQSAEDDEQFTAVLSNPSPGVTIRDSVATVTISDDTVVSFELSPLSFSRREDQSPAMFTITKTTDTTRTITVLFNTVDGTALAGEKMVNYNGTGGVKFSILSNILNIFPLLLPPQGLIIRLLVNAG